MLQEKAKDKRILLFILTP